jgi:DNA-binding CsgD family transcriptional regulator
MLLGREHEVSVLRRVLDSAPRSVAKTALIEGGPGTGKTSLLRKAADLAQTGGFHTISVRGRAREQRSRFAVARHLVESMLAGLADDSPGEFPPGRDVLTDPFGSGKPDDAREHLAAMYAVTKEISSWHHLVIVIDDLQWVDTASLHYLDHLLARLDNVSVNLIATYTPSHPDCHAPLLADLTSHFEQRLVLQDLDEASAGSMLAGMLDNQPDAVFTQACLEATRCNPLFLAALSREVRRRRIPQDASGVAELAESGPVELAETLFTRYLGGATETLAALGKIAMLAESATPDVVAELIGSSSRAELDAALRQPIDLGLLRAERGIYSFVYPVLRSAVFNRIPPTERERQHWESAKVLHKSGAPKERVARELLRADPREQQHWAADVLNQSAQEAAAATREDDARRYLQAALALCPEDGRGRILRRLGQIEVYSDPSAAAEYLRLALEYPWPDKTAAEINTELASAAYLADGAAAAAEALSDGLQKITSGNDRAVIESDVQVFKVMAGTASAHDVSGDHGSGEHIGQQHAVLSTLRELWSGRSRARALRYAEESVRNSAFSGHPMWHVIPMVTMVYCDEFGIGQAECDQLIARSRQQASTAMRTTALLIRALINYRIGDLIQCHDDAVAVLEMLPGEATDDDGHGITRRFAASKAVAALLEMGYHDDARAQLDHNWPASDCCDALDCALLLFERGRLRVAAGELREGLRDLEECGRRSIQLGQENPAVCPWRAELALVHAALGNVEQAIRWAEDELERARIWGAPRALGIALRAAGLAHRDQRGQALLMESYEVLSDSNALLEHARTRLHLGIALRKRNRLAEAREHLRESRILAEKCGARPLSLMAGQELVAACARPRRAAQIGPDALTPSERRVAMLAAQGHTNREIAEQLHVLQRTVEIHLSRTYHKLGIPGRGSLAVAISP